MLSVFSEHHLKALKFVWACFSQLSDVRQFYMLQHASSALVSGDHEWIFQYWFSLCGCQTSVTSVFKTSNVKVSLCHNCTKSAFEWPSLTPTAWVEEDSSDAVISQARWAGWTLDPPCVCFLFSINICFQQLDNFLKIRLNFSGKVLAFIVLLAAWGKLMILMHAAVSPCLCTSVSCL